MNWFYIKADGWDAYNTTFDGDITIPNSSQSVDWDSTLLSSDTLIGVQGKQDTSIWGSLVSISNSNFTSIGEDYELSATSNSEGTGRGGDMIYVEKLTSTTAVLVYVNSAQSNWVARIITNTDGVISSGSEQTLAAYTNYSDFDIGTGIKPNNPRASIAVVDSTHFVLTAVSPAVTPILQVFLYSISGTTVTLQDTDNVATSADIGVMLNRVTFLDTNKVVISYARQPWDGGLNRDIGVVLGTISGSTLTLGTAAIITPPFSTIEVLSLAIINTTKVMISWDDSSDYVATTFDLSGTTFTANTTNDIIPYDADDREHNVGYGVSPRLLLLSTNEYGLYYASINTVDGVTPNFAIGRISGDDLQQPHRNVITQPANYNPGSSNATVITENNVFVGGVNYDDSRKINTQTLWNGK